jgi:translation initiation factor 4E
MSNIHKLKNSWTLWYHDGGSDWTKKESYQSISEFDTVEDFWKLYNNMPSVADHYVFLMKKGHLPMWEVPENIKGGAWLFKVPKIYVDSYWLKFTMYLITETIISDKVRALHPDLAEELIGLSLSPRNYNSTIKIWNKNSEKCKNLVEFNDSYIEFQHGKSLYKSFTEPDKEES